MIISKLARVILLFVCITAAVFEVGLSAAGKSDLKMGNHSKNIEIYDLKVLNQDLMGIYVRLIGSRGTSSPIHSGVLKSLLIDSKPVSTWYIDQRLSDNTSDDIEHLQGKFSTYFSSDLNQIKGLNQIFFKLKRRANRIQIYRPKTIVQSNLSQYYANCETSKKLTASGTKQESKSNCNKAISVRFKLKQFNQRKAYVKGYNTESRRAIKQVISLLQKQQRIDPAGKPAVFSKMKTASFFDIELINRSKRPKQYYKYKTKNVKVVSKNFTGDFKANKHNDNAMNHLEIRNNNDINSMVVVQIPESLRSKNEVVIKMVLTPQNGPKLQRIETKSLNPRDFTWLTAKTQNSKLALYDTFINNLYSTKKYQQLISEIISTIVDEKNAKIPHPLLVKWAYLTAKSHEGLQQFNQAVIWYRKVIKMGPYSNEFKNAIYKVSELNNMKLFSDD